MSQPEAEYSENSESRLVVQREQGRLKEWEKHFNLGSQRRRRCSERGEEEALQGYFLFCFCHHRALMTTGYKVMHNINMSKSIRCVALKLHILKIDCMQGRNQFPAGPACIN